MTSGEIKRAYTLLCSNEWRETVAVWLSERESAYVEQLIAKGGDEYRYRVQEVRALLNLKDALKRDIETLNKKS